MIFRLVGIAIALGLCGAAPAPPKLPPGAERLKAWADRVVYKTDSGDFSFTGNVVVIKGNLRVECRRMEGKMDPKTRRFITIVATGDVKMTNVADVSYTPKGRPRDFVATSDAWQATCEIAIYDLRTGRITMKGGKGKPRPRLWRAKGFGEADTIIFLPEKGEYELMGNPVIRGNIPTGPSLGGPAAGR